MLFIIPVIVDIHGHRFEIYTLVSEIHENVDLVLGIKNVFELEGVINSRDCQFEFLNRSVQIYPEKEAILKPDEQKLVKVKAPFVDENLRTSNNQNYRWKYLYYFVSKVKIYVQQGSLRYKEYREKNLDS